MDLNALRLPQEAVNAHLVEDVVAATSRLGETAEQALIRAAAIAEQFRAFEPSDAMEAMIAAHCVNLRYMANDAMHDADNPASETMSQPRMRAAAMAISRQWYRWMATYETLRAEKATRVAAAAAPAAQQPTVTRTPEPEPPRKPKSGSVSPPPATAVRPATPPAPLLPRAALGTGKHTLMSSVATLSGLPANTRLSVPPPTRPA